MSFLVKQPQKGLILYSEHNGSNVTVKGECRQTRTGTGESAYKRY